MGITASYITRFAPSPTGLLHIGHAFSARAAYEAALQNNGRFLLRIEDIDTTRCKSAFIDAIYEDLAWLGLRWESPVRRQSDHMDDYQTALEKLKGLGVVYPCFCTRKEIQAELERAPSAPHGPDGALYPGTCRNLQANERVNKIEKGIAHAWRLDLSAALSITGNSLQWVDQRFGEIAAKPEELGDIILARKDTPTSYHLSVVVDDGLQGITHIIRGEDLFHATHIHVVLQRLLQLPTPIYHHHKLLLDENGQRFAKRNKSVTLQSLRKAGIRPDTLFAQETFK